MSDYHIIGYSHISLDGLDILDFRYKLPEFTDNRYNEVNNGNLLGFSGILHLGSSLDDINKPRKYISMYEEVPESIANGSTLEREKYKEKQLIELKKKFKEDYENDRLRDGDYDKLIWRELYKHRNKKYISTPKYLTNCPDKIRRKECIFSFVTHYNDKNIILKIHSGHYITTCSYELLSFKVIDYMHLPADTTLWDNIWNEWNSDLNQN